MTTEKPDKNGDSLTVKIYLQLRSYDRKEFYNTGPWFQYLRQKIYVCEVEGLDQDTQMDIITSKAAQSKGLLHDTIDKSSVEIRCDGRTL